MPTFKRNLNEEYSFGSDKLSISEPNLSDRFSIKHLHEYLTIDDLKYYRRRKPFDLKAKSHFNLYQPDGVANSGLITKCSGLSEYKAHYLKYNNLENSRRLLLRRASSLKLEGIMPYNKSENQDCFLWYTPEEYKRCRIFPIMRTGNFRLGGDMYFEPEYRSSYITPINCNRSMKILPREMFQINNTIESVKSKDNQFVEKYEKSKNGIARNTIQDTEYNLQFIPFCIEKAKSIPQISHIQIQGKFHGVPEYTDSYRMYANYSKPQTIKRTDNLRISGSEVNVNNFGENQHPKNSKTDHHFRSMDRLQSDLHLNDSNDFKAEYRSEYLNFPRTRPIVIKPKSTFSLPNSSTKAINPINLTKLESNDSTTSTTDSCNLNHFNNHQELIKSPEYRKACYNYQIRKRSPLLPNETHLLLKEKEKVKEKEEGKSFVLPNTCQIQQTSAPKFGRRATAQRNANNCRQKISIIEGNPHYRNLQPTDDTIHNSFVILPDKHNTHQRLSL